TAKGRPKILRTCTLPLTGTAVVDLIITDLAVFETGRAGGTGMTLIELADGVTLGEVREKTGADFKVAPDLKTKAA
ncbi:MAG TPA: succinyl-CoA--3-ketoacid-CoA transferase, partial [Methylocella sp.]|nr:succinyl-CoA--3-ketoacid-CoA transferase [Methylocella sp.]